jgi:Chaperone of endosialidase
LVSRVQTQRLSAIGVRPVAGSRAPGELYVNWPDMQLGVIDETQNPNDLLAVRFFSVNTTYASGDVVWQGGHLWHANQAIPAGPFNPAQWDQNTTAGTGGYLPLTGGTLTGALILASDPISLLGAATKQYVDHKLSLTGGTLTGGLTLSAGNLAVSAGNISASGSGTFGSIQTVTITATGAVTVNSLTSNSNVSTKGSVNGLIAYDRGNSGGNTSNYLEFYRDANIGRLNMTEAGDILTLGTSGAATFNFGLSVTKVGHYPLSLSTSATYHCGISMQSGSSHTYNLAAFNDGTFGVFDAVNGVFPLQIAAAGGTTIGGALTAASTLAVNSTLTAYGALVANSTLTVYGTSALTGPVSINGVASNYPLLLNEPSSQHCVIAYTVSGVREWLAGSFASGVYTIYDASAGAVRFTIDTAGNINAGPGAASQFVVGQNGGYDIAASACFSPRASGLGAGGSIICYGYPALATAIKSRVDITNAYLAYWTYSTTGVGWVTTDGGNTFYSTACDARLKDNIRPLASEIDVGDIIDRLNPVAFEWKPYTFKSLATKDHEGRVIKEGVSRRFDGHTGYGFVAQELYEVVPHLVQPAAKQPREDGVGNTWGADYSKLIPYLVAEIQSLRARLAKIEGK